MLEYARWKYILVAVVLLLALLFALPNFFGDDPALQVARKDHAPIDDRRVACGRGVPQGAQRPLRQELHRQRSAHGALRQRRQSAAPRATRSTTNYAGTYITALSFAPRTPAFLRALGLRPMPLGLDLRGGLYLLYQVDVNAAVDQAARGLRPGRAPCPGRRQHPVQGRHHAWRWAMTRLPNAVRVVLPPEADLTAARTAREPGAAGAVAQHREPRQRRRHYRCS